MSKKSKDYFTKEIARAAEYAENLKEVLESLDESDDDEYDLEEVAKLKRTIKYSLVRVLEHKQNLMHIQRRVDEQ